MKAYNNLKKYIEIDNIIIDKDNDDDFTEFCQNHIDDIDEMLTCVDEILFYIDNMEENDFDNTSEYNLVMYYMRQIKEIIKKVID